MNTQGQIAAIEAEAAARIAAIRQAESALAAAVAANALSEQQRAEEEQRRQELAAALATWEGETLPAIQTELTELAADLDEHRLHIANVEEMIRTIPASHNALGRRMAAILHHATAARLALPDVTAKNRGRLADDLRESLTGGRHWGAGVGEGLRDHYERRHIRFYPLTTFHHREEK